MRVDLNDVTFVIPFFADSPERVDNLHFVLDFLQADFDTNIILVESDEEPTSDAADTPHVHYIFHKKEGEIFHRTRVINQGLKMAATSIVSIYDTDVIFDPFNIIKAAKAIREGADFAYPYSGRFVDIDRSILEDGLVKERASFATDSVGGAVFMNREAYKKAGLENEHIIGWGPEDRCRYERMRILGYQCFRSPGACHHIEHPRGVNSSALNPNTDKNTEEMKKVGAMSKEELLKYISTWV